MMKKLILSLSVSFAAALAAPAASAAGGGAVMDFTADYSNTASMQRGARNFMNYCAACHGLKYLRYSSIEKHLEIPRELIESELMFGTDNFNGHIETAMPPESAEWFGQQPPDLSLTARSRGADWIYSFLNTFYVDPEATTGYNNLQLKGAAMPHVLAELQGIVVKSKDEEAGDGHGGGHGGNHGLKLVQDGALSPEEYEAFTADLTNFLAFAAEPGKADRIALGWNVMFYLFLLFGLTYLLKREFWRDVH
ncbi:MAG: cytochrome c1 [Algiphilus sp.]